MPDLKDLLQSKNDKATEMRGMVDTAEQADRAFSEDEQKRFDSLEAEIAALEKRIANHKRIKGFQAPGDSNDGPDEQTRLKDREHTKSLKGSPETQVLKRFSLTKAISETADDNLTGLEREIAQEGERSVNLERKAPALGNRHRLRLPTFFVSREELTPQKALEMLENRETLPGPARDPGYVKRDLTVGVDTQGGHKVETTVQALIPFLRPQLITERIGATVLTGLTGDLKFPRNDAIGSIAWEGETDTTAETSPTLDQFTLAPKRGSAFTEFSRQLMIQWKNGDVENFVRNDLRFATQNGVDTVAMYGGGANEPTGIGQTAGIGDVAMGANGGAPTWPKIVEFLTDMQGANADMGNLAWVFTPETIGKLMTIERATNTAQFLLNEPGNTLLGSPVFVSNNLPKNLTKGTGTGLHMALRGNWSELIIAQFGTIDLIVDPYTRAKDGMIVVVVNSYWDVGLRHPASFVASKDIDVS